MLGIQFLVIELNNLFERLRKRILLWFFVDAKNESTMAELEEGIKPVGFEGFIKKTEDPRLDPSLGGRDPTSVISHFL